MEVDISRGSSVFWAYVWRCYLMTKDRNDIEEFDHDYESFQPEHDEEQYDLEYNYPDDSNAKAMETIEGYMND